MTPQAQATTHPILALLQDGPLSTKQIALGLRVTEKSVLANLAPLQATGEAATEGEEGAVMGVRLLSDPEYPTGWWRLVGGPNPQIIMPPLHPIYILHGCAAWNGAVLFSEVKK